MIQQSSSSTIRTSKRKSLVGVVTSNKMDKTITVEVASKTSHPVFKKGYIKHKRYHAHDEKEEANIGDKVSINETRPLSKTKRWRLVKVLERAK